MRLFLSSQGLGIGTAPEALTALMGGTTRVGVIAGGAYLDDPAKRRMRIDRDLSELRALGLEPSEVDLDDPAGASSLQEYDAVWMLGGDVIALRTALTESGADHVIRSRLAKDSLVYAGYSAGACVLGPAFPGPDGSVVPGLEIVPFTIAPHANEVADGLTRWFSDHNVAYLALRDGEAVVIDADGQRRVGQPEHIAPR